MTWIRWFVFYLLLLLYQILSSSTKWQEKFQDSRELPEALQKINYLNANPTEWSNTKKSWENCRQQGNGKIVGNSQRIVWMYLTILRGCHLKGYWQLYLSNSSDLLTSQHSKTGSSNMLTQSLRSHLKQSIHFSVTSAGEPLFSYYSYLFENHPEECLPFWRIKLLSCTGKSG